MNRPACRSGAALAVLALAFTGAAVHAQNASSSNEPPPVTSPERGAEGDVTLRVRAPAADSVELVSSGDIPAVPFGEGLAMHKGDSGVWSVTLDDVGPGSYRYAFEIDGVTTTDPVNTRTSESNSTLWSLFHVPGSGFMDTRRVPHGAVAEVHYYSSELERHRRMHVYTPPGYERGRADYPVLYLLHGAMDSDDSWSTVGRAGFILDNLIAAGDAEPMIVVMPNGHQGSFTMGGGSGLGIEAFAREFAADVKPHVERTYRVSGDRSRTAIAGLSMGGAHTLEIAFEALPEYGYIGVFSSGTIGEGEGAAWQDRHADALTEASLRRGLELVWFATGSDDFLIETTERTVEMLRGHGFDVEYEESTGGHTWINWREYLSDFAPRLFR